MERAERRNVHEKILCENPLFFKTATKKEWQNEDVRKIPLPNDEIEVVDLYHHWLYCEKIFRCKTAVEAADNNAELELLTTAYGFREKIQDAHFKDAIVDAIVSCVNTLEKDDKRYYPVGRIVDRAYKYTPTGPPIRGYSSTCMCIAGLEGGQRLQTMSSFYPILCYLNTRELPSGTDPTSSDSNNCLYHHHEADKNCYAGVWDARREC